MSMGNPLPSMLGKMKDIGAVRLHRNHLSGGGVQKHMLSVWNCFAETLWELERGKLCADCKRGRPGTQGEELRRTPGFFVLGGSAGNAALSNGSDRQRLYSERFGSKLCWRWESGRQSAEWRTNRFISMCWVLRENGKNPRRKSRPQPPSFCLPMRSGFLILVCCLGIILTEKENTFDQMDRADLAWSGKSTDMPKLRSRIVKI